MSGKCSVMASNVASHESKEIDFDRDRIFLAFL
jgi:hypothetical protein